MGGATAANVASSPDKIRSGLWMELSVRTLAGEFLAKRGVGRGVAVLTVGAARSMRSSRQFAGG